MAVRVYNAPPNIPLNADFVVAVKRDEDGNEEWLPVAAYAVDIRVRYLAGFISSAEIRPRSLNIKTETSDENNTITSSLRTPKDVMLELNGNKWTALHLLTNAIDHAAPTHDTDEIVYFGPGFNQGSDAARTHIADDRVNLLVPSNKPSTSPPGPSSPTDSTSSTSRIALSAGTASSLADLTRWL